MKRCAACQRVYADETLNFCLDDGAWLDSYTNEPTAVIEDELPSEAPTLHRLPDIHPDTIQDSAPNRWLYPQRKISRSAVLSLVIALISTLAVLYWYQRSRPQSSAIRSIAVLPFKPLSPDSRDESLEMGMAETLITRLSNLKQLAVRPMSSVRKYSDVQTDSIQAGRDVGAQAVLEGSIQKANDQIRVTVRLIDVNDGGSIWSEKFDERFTDIFRVQDSIAAKVVSALALQLSSLERERLNRHSTDNPEAYQLYLDAQLAWNARRGNHIEDSLALYQQALEKDPNFALAHVGVADAYISLSGGGARKITMQEAEAKARPHILKALEIDDTLAQAHNVLAELKYQYEFDWDTAETEFKRAIELNPNVAWIRQAYGWFLMLQGRFDEATAEMDMARVLDPSSLTINVARGRLYYFSRQYDLAIEHWQRLIASEPNDFTLYFSLIGPYEQKQMYAEVTEAYLKFLSLTGRFPEDGSVKAREAFRRDNWRGFNRQILATVQEIAKTQPVRCSIFATLHTRLGQKDEAFKWLNKCIDQREPSILQLKVEPTYDPLRSDSRFPTLLNRIGLKS